MRPKSNLLLGIVIGDRKGLLVVVCRCVILVHYLAIYECLYNNNSNKTAGCCCCFLSLIPDRVPTHNKYQNYAHTQLKRREAFSHEN